MSARDNILARLRRSAPTVAPALPDVQGFYTNGTQAERSDLVERFTRNIEAAHAEVHRVGPEGWPQHLAQLCQAKGLQELLVSEAVEAQLDLGFPCALKTYRRTIESWKTELFTQTEAAFTFSRGAIAETGTLILWPDPAEPRLMSLVPPVHFVLLKAEHIHPTFQDVVTREGWGTYGTLPTNALLISGPSKTADIQQTLAYGAHGPKELIVLLQDGEMQ